MSANPRRKQKVPKKRTYDATRRAAQAAGRRAEVLAAALSLLDQPGAPTLSMEEVAAAAGVSRATVYNQFGSRSAFLSAVLQDLGRVIHYERVQAAQHLERPVEALVATIREACRCWAARELAIRRVLAMGVLDQDVDALNLQFERYRRAEMRTLAARLHADGALGPAMTLERAAELIGAFTSPGAYHVLRVTSPPAQVEVLLNHLLFTSLGIPLNP